MVGRRLSQGEAKRLLAKFEIRAEGPFLRVQGSDATIRCWRHRLLLTRSRISLPALKSGNAFSCTGTIVPVRGLRPVRAGRTLT